MRFMSLEKNSKKREKIVQSSEIKTMIYAEYWHENSSEHMIYAEYWHENTSKHMIILAREQKRTRDI